MKHSKTPAPKVPVRYATVDRIEDEVVMLDVDGREQSHRRADFPYPVREGDVVNLATLGLDEAATAQARERVRALQDKAGETQGSGGGSFDL